MSQQEPSKDFHEVDLKEVSVKTSQWIEKSKLNLLKQFVFVKKNIIVLLIIIIVGYFGGLFLDSKPKFYNQEVVVVPNFNSYDYLYAKINELNAKIENNQMEAIEAIGFQDPKNIIEISIKAVPDPYKLIEFKKDNFELLKLLSENGNLTNIVKEEMTTRHYKFHKISILTKKAIKDQKVIEVLMEYLNSDIFFEKQKAIGTSNEKYRLNELDSTNLHVTRILKSLVESSNLNQTKENVLILKEGLSIEHIMGVKDNLIKERNILTMEIGMFDKIIKDIIVTQNTRGKEWLFRKGRFLVPFILILLFIFYKRSKEYYKQNIHLISQV